MDDLHLPQTRPKSKVSPTLKIMGGTIMPREVTLSACQYLVQEIRGFEDMAQRVRALLEGFGPGCERERTTNIVPW